jgi:hypothetical protein
MSRVSQLDSNDAKKEGLQVRIITEDRRTRP